MKRTRARYLSEIDLKRYTNDREQLSVSTRSTSTASFVQRQPQVYVTDYKRKLLNTDFRKIPKLHIRRIGSLDLK